VDKVYDRTTAASVNFTTDAVLGDNVVANDTANFSDKNVGTGKTVSVTGIFISGSDAGNYNLLNTTASTTAATTPKALTVSATGMDKIYDDTTAATVTLADNHISGDSVSDSSSGANFADKTVGTGKAVSVSGISISGADAGNYALQNSTATTTANITQRDLTASAHGADKVYDATTAATVTFTTDALSGDSVTATDSAGFAAKNVGTAKP